MKRIFSGIIIVFLLLVFSSAVKAEDSAKTEYPVGIKLGEPVKTDYLTGINPGEPAETEHHTETKSDDSAKAESEYLVGIDDVLDISIIQPEQISLTVTVSPDGSITFPYIGKIQAKGRTLTDIQEEALERLSDGYLKYPVISLSLRELRSRKFFVYGEVNRPGAYPLGENITVLMAISSAGGFTKFASSSRVKVLRLKKDKNEYQEIKVNINAAMKGSSTADILIQPDDIIVISEGIF